MAIFITVSNVILELKHLLRGNRQFSWNSIQEYVCACSLVNVYVVPISDHKCTYTYNCATALRVNHKKYNIMLIYLCVLFINSTDRPDTVLKLLKTNLNSLVFPLDIDPTIYCKICNLSVK